MVVVITEADWKKYIAESIGTFFLTMGGMLAIMGATGFGFLSNGGGIVAIAAAHGTILAMMVYAFGGISGGHFNPAISIALFLQKKLGQRDLAMYMLFQVVGATIGALFAVALIPLVPWTFSAQAGATLGILTASPTAPYFSPGAALMMEIFMTFMLATTVSLVVAGGEKMSAMSGALIGGTLFACILWGGAFTGASLNPARSLGPAIVSGTNPVVWASIWVYILGPIIGGGLAAFGFMWFRGDLHIHLGSPSPPAPAMQTALPAPSTTPPTLPELSASSLPSPIMSQPPQSGR